MINLSIDKQRTALVVIDLQNGIVGRDTAPYSADQVVINVISLAEVFRKNSMPVFLVRVKQSPDGRDGLRPAVDEAMWSQGKSLPTDWSEIIPELGPKSEDIVITKHQWGAFYGTELDLQLRRRGIATIVLCGISTNIGVESTARFAYEYGYSQVFAEDAMTAMSSEEHSLSVTKIFPRIGLVRKTNEILAAARA
jgi:nicotinamidase-related amidase